MLSSCPICLIESNLSSLTARFASPLLIELEMRNARHYSRDGPLRISVHPQSRKIAAHYEEDEVELEGDAGGSGLWLITFKHD